MSSFGCAINVAVIGAAGGIGGALAAALDSDPAVANVLRLSRSAAGPRGIAIDIAEEATVARAAARAAEICGGLHLVIVATGLLHAEGLAPEKSWRALDREGLSRYFLVNAIGPALAAKHFLPLLPRKGKSAFAVLSARVGSIGDNRLGGWYGYRASKAALNMIVRTLAIELARRHPAALCVGLHPGTVDTDLSRPFQGGVSADSLRTPEEAAAHLLGVIDGLGADGSGRMYDWRGLEVPP